jgi:hypothetical protein
VAVAEISGVVVYSVRKEEKEIIMGRLTGVDRQNLEVKTSP